MGTATPETLGWIEVRREDDNALLGYVQPATEDADGAADDNWRPLTVFGYPLTGPTTHRNAVAEVRNRGLDSLLDRWEFRSETDGEWYSCEIMEAAPGRIRVRVTDYGLVIGNPEAAQWFEIENPTPERFRPKGRPTPG